MSRAIEERKERINLLRQRLKEAFAESKDKPINMNEFVAKFVLETGVSKRRAEEYLKMLEQAGEIGIAQFYIGGHSPSIPGIHPKKLHS